MPIKRIIVSSFFTLLVISLVAICGRNYNNEISLHRGPFPILENGRWGFINEKGEVIIQPHFRNVGEFSSGLAPAREEGLWGFIDTTGQWKIKPQFDFASAFHYGRAGVWKNKKQWLIDSTNKILQIAKDGEELFSLGWKSVKSSACGITNFSNENDSGKSWNKYPSKREAFEMICRSDKKLGKNKNLDELLIAEKLIRTGDSVYSVRGFPHGVYEMDVLSERKELTWFPSKKKFVKTGMSFDEADLIDKFLLQDSNYVCRLADTCGNFIGNASFTDVLGKPFSHPLTWVMDSKNLLWGAIDATGNYVIQPKWSGVGGQMSDGSVVVRCYDTILVRKFLDTALVQDKITHQYFFEREPAWNSGHREIYTAAAADTFIRQAIADRWGWIFPLFRSYLIDPNGKQIAFLNKITLPYQDASSVLLAAYDDSTYGYIDRNAKWKWRRNLKQAQRLGDTLSPDAFLMNLTFPISYASNCKQNNGYECDHCPVTTRVVDGDYVKGKINVVVGKSAVMNGSCFPVEINNLSADTAWFRHYYYDGLQMVLEAKDSSGNWICIQRIKTFTPEPYEPEALPPRKGWQFSVPILSGIFKTKFRLMLIRKFPKRIGWIWDDYCLGPNFAMYKLADRSTELENCPYEFIYSNEFDGSINPGVFWRMDDGKPEWEKQEMALGNIFEKE